MTIASLRENYKEVILSPRVRNVPYHYFITIFTHFFIIGVSVSVVFLYTYLSTSTLCQAIPLGQKSDTPGLVCESLQLRKDTSVRVQQRVDGGIIVEDSFLVGFEMFITDKEFLNADLSKLQVADVLFEALQTEIESLDGDDSSISDPIGIVDFYLSNEFAGFFNVSVTDLSGESTEINFGDDRGGTENGGSGDIGGGLGGGAAGAVASNNEDFSLFVTWFTRDGGVRCTLRNDFVVNQETRNIIACFDPDSPTGSPIFQLIWISEGYLADSRSTLPVNTLAFFQNIHGVGGFVSTLTDSQQILKTIFANNFFSCCFPDQLDNTEYFGIISGIGFLLEGVFTFLVAYIFFQGRLPKVQGDDPKELGFSYSLRFGQDVQELYDNEEQGTRESMEDKDQHEIQQKSVHTVERSDIMRVVFNPRCRYIPYSSAVSFVTLTLLIGMSAVLALWYRDLRTITVCEPQVASEIAGARVCEDVTLESFVYESVIPGVGGNSVPLGLLSSLFIERNELANFDIENLFLPDDLLVVADAACIGVLKTLERCIEDLATGLEPYGDSEASFNTTSSSRTFTTKQEGSFTFVNSTTNGDTTEIYTISIEAERVVNGTGLIVFLDEDTFHRELGVSYTYEMLDLNGNRLVSYNAEYYTTFTSGPEIRVSFFLDTGDIIVAVLQNIIGANGNSLVIREPFKSAFTQCCREDSLEYYDYLGLMMGYVALFEGILTFIVAMSFYGGLRLTEIVRNSYKK